MSKVRRVDANKYDYTDSRRYVFAKDGLSEPEVIKAYCANHPEAVCVGGYGYFGCLPEGKKGWDFIKYDSGNSRYIRTDGKIVEIDETYCGRKIPSRNWKGEKLFLNQIWNTSGLGHPDLVDGNLVIEAKGGVPSLQKTKTAFGQLVFYKEYGASFNVAFLFPKVWLEAENLRKPFNIFRKYGIVLIPI